MTLRDRHKGEMAHIVGRGPSLLVLTAGNFGPGPVIALNQSILRIRRIGLSNPIYTMQKDGCVQSDWQQPPIGGRCEGPCGAREPMVTPIEPETLVLSADESPHCFRDYPHREVIRLGDFGEPWYTMSAPTAVLVAKLMGCTRLVMLGQDAHTHGDTRTVEAWGIVDYPLNGYHGAGLEAARLAKRAGLDIEWVA